MCRILKTLKPARLELSRPRLEEIFITLVSSQSDTVEDRRKLAANLVDNGGGRS